MKRVFRLEPKRGDIFEIPGPDSSGYGVVVVGGGVFYTAIFRNMFSARPKFDQLVSEEIGLVGWTMDALLFHRRWSIVARQSELPTEIPYPNWKVRIGEDLFTTDFRGDVLGPIRPEEEAVLDFKFSTSPIAYENALLALNGFQPWVAMYDKLTVSYARQYCFRS